MAYGGRSEIGECSQRCLELFLTCTAKIASLQPHDDSRVEKGLQDEFVRFKLWSANIGVFAVAQASLDFRVRELADVRELFLRELNTVECRLEQFKEDVTMAQQQEGKDEVAEGNRASPPATPISREPNTPFKQWNLLKVLHTIHEGITWLNRLSKMVRKASFTGQNGEAETFRVKNSDGNESDDLSRVFTKNLRERYHHIIRPQTRGIEEYLINRLLETMTKRHERILHRRSQPKKWSMLQHSIGASILPPRPQKGKGKAVGLDHNATTALPRVFSVQNTMADEEMKRKAKLHFIAFKATSAPLEQKYQLLIPPLPKRDDKNDEILCPYCYLILPDHIAQDHWAWVNHIKGDLDAYICVFPNCDNPNLLYSSGKDWLSHVRSQHRMRWRCPAADHEPLFYQRPGDLETHMKTEHAGSFPENKLSLIVEFSAEPIKPTFERCPFCTGGSRNMEDHVSQHLIYFALLSLPWPDNVGEWELHKSVSDDGYATHLPPSHEIAPRPVNNETPNELSLAEHDPHDPHDPFDPSHIYRFLHNLHITQDEWAAGSGRLHPYETALQLTTPQELGPASRSHFGNRSFGSVASFGSTASPSRLSWSLEHQEVNSNHKNKPQHTNEQDRVLATPQEPIPEPDPKDDIESRRGNSDFDFDSVISRGTMPSTRPSRHSIFRPATIDVQVNQSQAGPLLLPCEFAWEPYGKCDRYFNPLETDSWIDHVISNHLNDQLPSKALCWFCDDIEFDSKDFGDRRATFDARMDHIRAHIYDGKTIRDIRPDFHFLEHMRKYNLITSEEAKRVRNYTEGTLLEDIYEHDFEPAELVRKKEIRAQVIIDHQKEDRNRKRHYPRKRA